MFNFNVNKLLFSIYCTAIKRVNFLSDSDLN